MKIHNVWSLHYQNFLIEMEGTEEERAFFLKWMESIFGDKRNFIINNRSTEMKGGENK